MSDDVAIVLEVEQWILVALAITHVVGDGGEAPDESLIPRLAAVGSEIDSAITEFYDAQE